MAESRDLRAELKRLEDDLGRCFRRTFPSKQFQAEMMLATISLELKHKRLSRSRDLGERRKLKQEIEHGISVVRQGLRMLWQSRWGEDQEEMAAAAHSGGFLFEGAAASPNLTG